MRIQQSQPKTESWQQLSSSPRFGRKICLHNFAVPKGLSLIHISNKFCTYSSKAGQFKGSDSPGCFHSLPTPAIREKNHTLSCALKYMALSWVIVGGWVPGTLASFQSAQMTGWKCSVIVTYHLYQGSSNFVLL